MHLRSLSLRFLIKNSLHYKQLTLNNLSFKVQLAQVTTDFLETKHCMVVCQLVCTPVHSLPTFNKNWLWLFKVHGPLTKLNIYSIGLFAVQCFKILISFLLYRICSIYGLNFFLGLLNNLSPRETNLYLNSEWIIVLILPHVWCDLRYHHTLESQNHLILLFCFLF